MSQILWCFYRLWRADISVLSQVRILYVMKKKNGTDEIWCSCSPGIPISLWRVLSPWLTKEIIFVCTVFLSFTLWMTCERTFIHAQSTLWIVPQNLQFTLWNSRLWDECLYWVLPLVTWIGGFSLTQFQDCFILSLHQSRRQITVTIMKNSYSWSFLQRFCLQIQNLTYSYGYDLKIQCRFGRRFHFDE